MRSETQNQRSQARNLTTNDPALHAQCGLRHCPPRRASFLSAARHSNGNAKIRVRNHTEGREHAEWGVEGVFGIGERKHPGYVSSTCFPLYNRLRTSRIRQDLLPRRLVVMRDWNSLICMLIASFSMVGCRKSCRPRWLSPEKGGASAAGKWKVGSNFALKISFN